MHVPCPVHVCLCFYSCVPVYVFLACSYNGLFSWSLWALFHRSTQVLKFVLHTVGLSQALKCQVCFIEVCLFHRGLPVSQRFAPSVGLAEHSTSRCRLAQRTSQWPSSINAAKPNVAIAGRNSMMRPLSTTCRCKLDVWHYITLLNTGYTLHKLSFMCAVL